MKIIPNSNILVDGKHSEGGKPVDTDDRNARSLVAQGLAKFAVTKPSETADEKPTKETAQANPAKETASRK